MSDAESSIRNFEWHRQRVLREKKFPNPYSENRLKWNGRKIQEQHGVKAAEELAKEFNSKTRTKKKSYFT